MIGPRVVPIAKHAAQARGRNGFFDPAFIDVEDESFIEPETLRFSIVSHRPGNTEPIIFRLNRFEWQCLVVAVNATLLDRAPVIARPSDES
jgi:hypothetical protein